MACCCCSQKTETEAQAIEEATKVDVDAGPLKNASGRCTDCLCIIALLACWIVMTALGAVVTGFYEWAPLPAGDPRRLLYGMDYLGGICSVDGKTRLGNGTDGYRKYDVQKLPYSYYMPSGALVCVEECPEKSDADRFLCTYAAQEALDAHLANGDVDAYWREGLQGVFDYECNFAWSTTEFLTYCVFDEVPDVSGALLTSSAMDPPSAAPTPAHTVSAAPTKQPVPRPTGRPVPAPTLRPTNVNRTTAVPTAAPSFNTSVPCTQSLDHDYCDNLLVTPEKRHLYCYSFFCPDCPLPGACDYACEFCDSPAPTLAPGDVEQADAEESEVYEEIAGDVYTASQQILVFGFGVAAALGFAYLLLLQIPALLTVLVWTMLVSLLCVLLLGGAFALRTVRRWEAEDPPLHDKQEIKAGTYVSYILFGCAALYLCVLCALRKRIALAIGILKEAARALAMMPALCLLPVIQCVGLVVFFGVWIVYVAYLASSGEIKTVTYDYAGASVSYKEFEYSNEQRYAALYLCFCWFWTSEFIFALGQLVIAAAVVNWYFSRNKAATVLFSPCAVLHLIGTIFKRHAGTAAFGGLLVAIVKTMQVVVQYVKRCTPAGKSKIGKIVLDCITCCLVAVEKCVRFLNKNAYIQTVLHGVGFCSAGYRAFTLIRKNGGRVMAVSLISTFVLFFGKLFVSLGTTAGFYVYAVEYGLADRLNGVIAPTAVVFVLAYFTVDTFNNIFDMCIWTILQCFVLDETQFRANPFASGSLKACIKATGKAAKKGGGATAENAVLKEQFDKYDADSSGTIEKEELKKLLAECTGTAPSDAEVAKMLKSVDTDGSGAVDFGEFETIHAKALDGTLEFEALKDAMQSFDALLSAIDDDDEVDDDEDEDDSDD